MAAQFKYAKEHLTEVFASVNDQGIGKTKVNKLLMGTYMSIQQEKDGWYKVKTAGKDGWVNKSHTSDDMGLKMFFIDVGQGDAILIEVGNKKILVDGGPTINLHNFLTKWQYSYLVSKQQPVHFDMVFVSHFDSDHFDGITRIINNENFTFGKIYHNGIARFRLKSNERPSEYNTDLGTTVKSNNDKYLTTLFDDINSLETLKQQGGLLSNFDKFADAVLNAKNQSRLDQIKRLSAADTIPAYTTNQKKFEINVLGPVLDKVSNKKAYKWFGDSSHTRNGHSLVLKFVYGNRSILLGGDLNTDSEEYLIDYYGNNNPLQVDVAKSCHHGASEFTVEFMKKVNPFATVISSGDNESYSHPRADAVGCAGKYSRGKRPLVFSTELARSISKSKDILFGMINLRCNGDDVVIAQMKEARKGADIWDCYVV